MGVWLGCALLFIEIVLRFCPVSDYFPAVAIDEENPISRPAFNRTGTRSRGWRFSPTNTIHYNNYGFINIHYYDPVSDTPLLAVVGDGTLEALSVPFEETLQGRLAAQLGIDGRAYSFAGAGAPLSQYLAWAQFARDEFKPEGFVFAIVRDDFDQSLAKYQDAPGFHYYHESRDGYELRLLPYQPTGRGDFILRHSALARYLTLNLQLQRSLQERSAPQGPHALDGSVIDPEERLDDSKTIAKVFLDELPRATGVDASRILFLVSGVELDPVIDPYWHSMRTFFTDEAVTRGYETIEMQPIPLSLTGRS